MEDTLTIVAGLNADSAKRRERAIRELPPGALQDPRVIEALQNIVSRDPVEYVRRAASEKLVAQGITPAASAVPVTLKEENAAKPALFAVGFTTLMVVVGFGAICICFVLILIGAGYIPL